MRKEEDEDQRVRNLFREITKLLLNAVKSKQIYSISSMRLYWSCFSDGMSYLSSMTTRWR